MAPALRETAAPLPLPLREGVTQLDGDAVAPRVPLCFGEAVGAPLLPLGDRVGVALPLQLPPFAQPTDDIDALPEMLAEMEAERDSPCEADGVGEGAGDRESQLAEGDVIRVDLLSVPGGASTSYPQGAVVTVIGNAV